MMRLTFLGTGTSTGVPVIGCRCRTCMSADRRDHRLRCSALLEVDDATSPDGMRRILFDCGPDFRQQIMGVDFRRLDAIFITHEHYDHVGGLDDLRPYSLFGDVTVYADPLCAQHLRERLPYCFTPKERRYPGVPAIDLEDIRPHEKVNVGGVDVTPVCVMHGKLPILGFRVGTLAYITDMKTLPTGESRYLRGIRTLVVNGLRHESHPTHQTIEEAVDFSHRLGLPETYLIHMSHHVRLHAEEDALLPPHVHMAYDGLRIEID